MVAYNDLIDIAQDLQISESPEYDEDGVCYISPENEDIRLVYKNGKYQGWYRP